MQCILLYDYLIKIFNRREKSGFRSDVVWGAFMHKGVWGRAEDWGHNSSQLLKWGKTSEKQCGGYLKSLFAEINKKNRQLVLDVIGWG